MDRQARRQICSALVAGGLLLTACGGGGSTKVEATKPVTDKSCVDQMVALANSAKVKAAVAAGADQHQFDALFASLDKRCSSRLDHLSDAEGEAMVARMDPAVVEYLGQAATTSFEKTGSAISGS